MSKKEWVFLILTTVVAVIGLSVYLLNLDMYRAVDNYHPIKGYTEFTTQLEDPEYVQDNIESWECSSSPILHSLYTYLTVEDAELSFVSFYILIGSYYYVLAATPFILLCFLRKYQRKKKKKGSGTYIIEGK